MSLYEALDLLFTAVQIVIDVITRLLHKKRKKRKRIKNSPPKCSDHRRAKSR